MRRTHKLQPSLMPQTINHPRAREMEEISRILDDNQVLAGLAADDLTRNVSAELGAPGMTGDQVLRCFIVKHMEACSYRDLHFFLVDSTTYRTFCRLGLGDDAPSRSTLQANIRALSERTLEMLNECLVLIAEEAKIEDGRKVRSDSTAVDVRIHAPTDSSLLFDGVRVLLRLMQQARELAPEIRFSNHFRRAKRRSQQASRAKNAAKRKEAYRDLVKVTKMTLRDAETALEALESHRARQEGDLAERLGSKLRRFIMLTWKVVDQTERRVFRGEQVPAREKIVSLFEDHADVIVKDNRKLHYGHKVFLTTGASSMVLDCVIDRGNTADSKMAVPLAARIGGMYGAPPQSITFDGGFASRENLRQIKALGIEQVCFSKRRGIPVSEMVTETWIYRRLQNFRAGIEGLISFLKRCFGLGTCEDSGWSGFKRYVWRSIIALNLLIMARRRLSQT